ncbi:hypothetical protein [Frisingicoccus sp.]|uniref:hypothetical protein n=1 Tax=Frisingicoccus sp. TaxID=1918627 RepID=UPI003AB378B3
MKKRKSLIKMLIIIFLIVYGICVIQVNMKYPQTKIRIVEPKQCIEYQGTTVSIENFYIMNKADINQYFSWERDNYGDCIGIMSEISIKNDSATEKKVDLTSLIFESGGWKNAIHYMAFTKLNEGKNMSLNPVLHPGETIKLKLPTFAAPIHMRKSQWKNFLMRDVYLTFSLYPEKCMAKLL